MTKKNRALYYTFFVIISIIFILITLEVSLRILKLSQTIDNQYASYISDKYLPYKPAPFSHVSGRSSTDEFDYDYKHNSHGLRDVEHSYKKSEGIFRILGLGDSFTYGAGANFEETYLFQLETLLNLRKGNHPRIEIIKAGIGRYFPEPERIFLEYYGKKYSPDLIIVGFVPNDIIDTFFGKDFVVLDKSGYLITREAKIFGSISRFFYTKSYLCRLILKTFINYRINQKYPHNWSEVYKPGRLHEKDWKKVEQEYEKMIEVAKNINSEIIFIHIPQKGSWTDRHTYPPKRLSSWALKNNVLFMDLLPTMKKNQGNMQLYYPKDGHCTPEGYHLIAEEIYNFLSKRNIIP